MSWKTLDQMDLDGKRVLTRVDINVPILDGVVTDATRILLQIKNLLLRPQNKVHANNINT